MQNFSHGPLRFPVRDAGPESAPVVVLLHGFPQDSSCWDAVACRLNDAGLRTLAPDQRGYGPQCRPPDMRDYRLSELVADTVALLDSAGLAAVHLVGHDWGGGLAWQVAQQHPERVDTLTVLSTPHPAAMAWATRHSNQSLRSWYMGAFQIPWLPERTLAKLLYRTLRSSGLNPAAARKYAARFERPKSLTGPINWYRALRYSGASGMSVPVQVPTTLVWGNRDPYLGRAAAERTREWVAADYRFAELNADHWLPDNYPGEVAAEILARIGRTGGD